MKRLLIILLLFPMMAWATGNGQAIVLETIKANPADTASVMRGAKFFAQNCMVCHTMKYLAHNKLAQKAGITLDKMPLKNKEWFLNIAPPDLSVIATVKGADWLYTYFHSFYKDASRPTGYNNLLEKNVVMMNIFMTMQGEQELITKPHKYAKPVFGNPKLHYYTVLKLVKAGSMSPEEFNETNATFYLTKF